MSLGGGINQALLDALEAAYKDVSYSPRLAASLLFRIILLAIELDYSDKPTMQCSIELNFQKTPNVNPIVLTGCTAW